MLLTKTALVKWNNKNRKYYESLGYVFTKNGDSFEVLVEHLTPSSKAEVEVLCDFCKETVVKKKFQIYKRQHHLKYGDCCIKCQPIKNKLCCLDKYGVDNGSKTQEAIDKIKNTSLEKYGVDNPSKSEQARQKISIKSKENAKEACVKKNKTLLEKYGTTNIMEVPEIKQRQKDTIFAKYGVYHPKQSEEIKAKERQHNLEKYGYEYVLQVPEVKEKSKTTCLKKYGVEYTLSSDEVRAKGVQTLLAQGKVCTSKQQIELYEMLKAEYGGCQLNYPCGRFSLDCMLEVNGIFIDIEYDGWYWHQDKQRDRRRDEVVKSKGYKVFRIVSDKKLPTIEQIREKIDFLITTQHKFAQLNLV